MKTVLFASACILFAATSFAQPTITGAANNPLAGETFYGHACDTNGAHIGPAGAAVTWNLTGLTVYQLDTTMFVSCASTPYCDSFPGSTLASSDGFGGYSYFITDAARWANKGYASPSVTDNQHFTDPENIISYPMTYNSVKVDSYAYNIPTIPWYGGGTDSFIADGYGTLMLPSGSYTNVLRVHTITHANDSDGTSSGTSYHVRSERYFWFNPGYHFPLLVMSFDSTGGTPYLTDVTYYTRSTTGIGDIEPSVGQLKVYPNPSKVILNVAYTSATDQAAAISLTDVAGHTQWLSAQEHFTQGRNSISYSTASMPAGVYLLRIQTNEEMLTEKVVIMK